MTTFCDFLRWYNNKDVVPTLDAMQKLIEFYHDKGIDMLKFGCTLPNLANICLHKSTDYKFLPFFLSDSDRLEKLREDMTGGPSIVFTRKAVANETFFRKSNNSCKSLVLMLINSILILCVRICPQVCIRDGATMKKHKILRQNRFRTFENIVMSYFQATRPGRKIESYYNKGKQKKKID